MDALQRHDVPYGNDWDSATEVAAWAEAADRTRPWRSQIRNHIANVVAVLRPGARILELGAYCGYSSIMIASTCGPGAHVTSIEIDEDAVRASRANVEVAGLSDRITFVHGSSTSPEVFDAVIEQVGGRRALVILDSAHDRRHVLAELRLYTQLVPVGGYVLVNDTHLDGSEYLDHGAGPFAAVEGFLEEDGRFVIDHAAQRFMISCMHSGMLRRVE